MTRSSCLAAFLMACSDPAVGPFDAATNDAQPDAFQLDTSTADTDAPINHTDSGNDGASEASAADGSSDAQVDSNNLADSGVRALSPNDISILFPASDRDRLWRADTAALTFAFFSELNTQRFPRLDDGIFGYIDGVRAEYDALRVVSLRIEPCARGCAAEVRVVLQATMGTVAAGFSDGAVHVIHQLDATQFSALQSRMVALRALSPENADPVLQVNPSLSAQGLVGRYAVALREALAETLSSATLHRIDFMTQTSLRTPTWEFGGLDFAQGAVVGPTTMVGFPTNTRLVVVRFEFDGSYNLRLDAAETPVLHPDAQFARAMESYDTLMNLSAQDRQSAYDAIVRRHNPNAVNRASADCASCHIAAPARNQNFFAALASTEAYPQESSATRVSGRRDTAGFNLRAFGYFEAEPVVSQRTANDTHRSIAMWPR